MVVLHTRERISHHNGVFMFKCNTIFITVSFSGWFRVNVCLGYASVELCFCRTTWNEASLHSELLALLKPRQSDPRNTFNPKSNNSCLGLHGCRNTCSCEGWVCFLSGEFCSKSMQLIQIEQRLSLFCLQLKSTVWLIPGSQGVLLVFL